LWSGSYVQTVISSSAGSAASSTASAGLGASAFGVETSSALAFEKNRGAGLSSGYGDEFLVARKF
jgi:hypothetical protein